MQQVSDKIGERDIVCMVTESTGGVGGGAGAGDAFTGAVVACLHKGPFPRTEEELVYIGQVKYMLLRVGSSNLTHPFQRNSSQPVNLLI